MKTFDWKPGSRIALDPNIAGAALEEIERKHGKVTPEIVLNEASANDHPLHGSFEWDDSAAARKWRLEQARYLVRMITVTIEQFDRPTPVRAYVSVTQSNEPDQRVYVGIESAMHDVEMREQVLSRAKRDLREWRERYAELRELASVFAAIDEVVEA